MPHTHYPEINTNPKTGKSSSNRIGVETTSEHINHADELMKDGKMQQRKNSKDKGGY